ncbi:MAG TPA: hypothetical protein DC046_15545, partial [Rhodospirillaceae bacterium]|nr:hypothetical protein [Rhodospirillaceae bacterium]
MVWISGGVARGRARREAHRAEGAEKEVLRLKTDVEMLEEKLRAADAKAKSASLPVPASDTQASG